jgi:hypothetical protein
VVRVFYLTWLHIFLVKSRDFSAPELLKYSWMLFLFGAVANLAGGWTRDVFVKRAGLRWGPSHLGLDGLGAATVLLALTIFTQDKLTTMIFLALAYACFDFTLPVASLVYLGMGGENAREYYWRDEHGRARG